MSGTTKTERLAKLERLMKKADLVYGRTPEGDSLILPFNSEQRGESIVWVALSDDGELVGVRQLLPQITVPDDPTKQAPFLRKVLELNESLSVGKLLLAADNTVGVGAEIELDTATADLLKFAVYAVVEAAADAVRQLRGAK